MKGIQTMKKIVFIFALLPSLVLWAQSGGGGVEYLYNLGADSFSTLSTWADDGTWIIAPTASLTGVGGFGYGVDRSGSKVGGFGFGFWEEENSGTANAVPNTDGVAGGFGGVIHGSQNKIGPFLLSANTRVGAGGISLGTQSKNKETGFFALYGAVDGELGVILTPYLAVSAYIGLSGIMGFPGSAPIVQGIPASGIRITWGSF